MGENLANLFALEDVNKMIHCIEIIVIKNPKKMLIRVAETTCVGHWHPGPPQTLVFYLCPIFSLNFCATFVRIFLSEFRKRSTYILLMHLYFSVQIFVVLKKIINYLITFVIHLLEFFVRISKAKYIGTYYSCICIFRSKFRCPQENFLSTSF
jgi:hypothetical protein